MTLTELAGRWFARSEPIVVAGERCVRVYEDLGGSILLTASGELFAVTEAGERISLSEGDRWWRVGVCAAQRVLPEGERDRPDLACRQCGGRGIEGLFCGGCGAAPR